MTNDNKNSNLLIFGLGIVAMFFAYIMYMKSKEIHTQPITQPAPQLTPQPMIQPVIQPIQYPMPQPQQSSLDNVELYKISEQLKTQSAKIQEIQDQQVKQMQNINQIENTKCSNVVSMNDGIYPSINNLNIKIPKSTNVRRENEEYVANKVFGMK